MVEKQFRAALISLGSKSSKMTAAAMEKYFKEVDMLQIKDIEIQLGERNPLLYQGQPMPTYDCIYIKGSFRYAVIARSITSLLSGEAYMPYLAGSFTTVHDKILTHIQLQSQGVPMPKTYLSATVGAAKNLLKSLNYPVIMKFPQGTQGKGVMFADSYAAASSVLDALESLKQPFLIQDYIETSGVDVRAFVVGDKVVAAMKRKAASGEKRSNVHAGGTTEVFKIPKEMENVAIRTAKAMGAEICGVDILESVKGPVVIEANLSPGLQGITQASGRDIADDVAKHLYVRTQEFRSSKPTPNAQQILDELEVEDGGVMDVNSLVGSVDFRGARILLPEIASKATGITSSDECVITFEKGRVEVKKGI
ncbi:MAG: ATP-grasp domain-containing protein [Nanoarchaeota archaeon]